MYDGDIDDEVEKWLDEYEKVFQQGIPLMQFCGTKEDLIKEIKKCIENNKEYDTSWWNKHPNWDT